MSMAVKKDAKAMNREYAPTQDIVPVEDVQDGIVKLKNGEYVKTLEVLPTNFHMMGITEQNNLIAAFARFHKIAPSHLQFKILTRPAEGNKHIDNIRKQVAKDAEDYRCNPHRRKQLEQYVALTEELSRYTAVTRRFFLIYRYEPSEDNAFTYEDIVGSMRATEQRIREYMSAVGNVVVQNDTLEEEDRFQVEIFYMLFNRKTSIQTGFEQHVNHVVKANMLARGLKPGVDPPPDLPAADFIAPYHVNLTHGNWLFFDGTFYSFFIIPGSVYPPNVYAAWLDELINAGNGIDVDIYAERLNKSMVLADLRHTLAFTKAKMRETPETSRDYEEVKDALDSCYYIKEHLNANEDIYNMYTLITVTADSVKMLRSRLREIKDLMKAKDMEISQCYFRFEQAFQMTLPSVLFDDSLKAPAKRNILTFGLASMYPLTSYEICQINGILLGVNSLNSSLFMPNIFDTNYFMNANMMLLGSTGGGKTFTLCLIILRFLLRGIKSYLIAPDKGFEFELMCRRVGGSFVKIAAGSPHCVNLLDVRPHGRISAYQGSLLSDRIQEIKIALQLLAPEITNAQLQRMDDILYRTYAKFHITDDNDSIYADKVHGVLKKMPTFGDLYDEMKSDTDMHDVAVVISQLVTGSAKNFNGQTNVDLSSKLVVFDISELKGKNLKAFGMYICSDFLMWAIRDDLTVNKALFFDELWRLISENRNAAEYVVEIWKTIRSYGGAAIGATQDINDYFALDDGKYGKAIISASAIRILKKSVPIEAKMLRDVLDLTDAEYKQIMRLGKPQGLFCTDNVRMTVDFRATEFERWNITTDRNDRAKRKEIGYYQLVGYSKEEIEEIEGLGIDNGLVM